MKLFHLNSHSLLLSLMWILLTCFILSCNQRMKEVDLPKSQKIFHPDELINKTIEYRYGENIYHVTFTNKHEMQWLAVSGEEEGHGDVERYEIVAIDSAKIFITWGEANGTGVSQVLDFESGMVYNHLIRSREISSGTGKIRILPE